MDPMLVPPSEQFSSQLSAVLLYLDIYTWTQLYGTTTCCPSVLTKVASVNISMSVTHGAQKSSWSALEPDQVLVLLWINRLRVALDLAS